VLASLPSRLRQAARLAASLPGQRRLPHLPRTEIERRRDAAAAATVRYAAANVPYYRDWFRREGVDPRDFRTAADLARLPLLDKAEVRRDPARFHAVSRLGRDAVPFVTSGSSGEPLTVWHDRDSLVLGVAHGEAEKEVMREAIGRRRGTREATIFYAQTTVRKITGAQRLATFVPRLTRGLTLDVTMPVEAVIAAINAFRPEVIVSYGSYLEALYRIVAARRLRMHRPVLVRYGGDGMTEPGRRLIEAEFGIPVYTRYMAIESFRIGYSCAERSGFHLREDLCHLRIVRPDGRTAAAGERGQVVISNLVNRGSVLLNYRLGDIGVMAPGFCPCGRSLALLASVEGRVEDVLALADGNIVHPRAVWSVFKGRPQVLRYQLVQTALDAFELRLVTDGAASFAEVVGPVLEEMRGLLGPVRIEVERCDELRAEPSGKFRPVVSRLEPG
jgi:phenylacetate-CoA ligase